MCKDTVAMAEMMVSSKNTAFIAIAVCIHFGYAYCEEIKPKGANAYQMVTGDDTENDRGHWNAIFDTNQYIYGKEPARFLKDVIGLVRPGKALDIAMGEGRNAVFLAKKGFNVEGVDISEVAIRKAKMLARDHKVSIAAINADLNHYIIRQESFDLIVNIQYLQRSLISQIKKGLKHGGVLVFENYTVDQLRNPGGEQLLRDYLLRKGELREMFSDLEILQYREKNDGVEAVAQLVAKKR